MVKPIVFLCLIVLLSGCLPLPTRQVTLGPTEILPDTEEMLAAPVLGSTEVIRLNSNQCASSAVTLAFPVGTEKEPPYDSRPRVILPPPEWEEEIVLPNALPYTSLHQRSARSIVIQAPNGNEYLWFSTGDTEDSGVYRYDPKSRQLLLYNTIDGYDAYPVDLFISSDGTLWGYTIVGYQQEVRENLSLLSRYEPETDSFVFVNDPLLTDNGKLFTRITDMTIDRQGIIWIAVRRDKASIISFSPSTEKVIREYQLGIKEITSLKAAPDGNLWFLSDEGVLYNFDVSDGNATSYQYLFDAPRRIDNVLYDRIPTNTLYFDRDGKLWISDLGWLNFSSTPPTFFRIIRSPVFVNDYASPHEQYRWEHPDAIYQSIDGSIWFSGPGLVKLTPSKAEWCLLASAPSRVAEDFEGNLWVVMFSRVYRFPLNSGQ